MNSSDIVGIKPLSGAALVIAAIMLTLANFVAVLNMTIANVAVPSIAGGLGSAMSQGTWVITAYAVGEAITVPLTGWLAGKFGSIKVFVVAALMFAVTSALCAISTSIEMLAVIRIFQGFAGGPLMPLSLTLLLKIFPSQKAGVANGIWSVATLIAPAVGPILGGYLCDEYNWSYAFLVNVPVALMCGFFTWILLKRFKEELYKSVIDTIGLILLVIWVACLQIMLDDGKNHDWFSSNFIVTLAIISSITFVLFIIWELFDKNPVVDLKIFRHRGFTTSVLTITLTFAAFFGINVLVSLWLQNNMGYTATDSGVAVSWIGLMALISAPFVSYMATRYDTRKIVFPGILLMAVAAFLAMIATTDMDFWAIVVPLMVLGLGMPFFFIPTTGLALSSVEEREMDSAAGLMNFLRTLGGAFATSIVTSNWEDITKAKHVELVDASANAQYFQEALVQGGATADVANNLTDYVISSQAVMLATNDMMLYIGVTFVISASLIWLAPKPKRAIDLSKGGH
ncbi:MAG: DHA2 family efflux MFS transporter permease subunit [Campylobacterales bacterium]